MEGLHPGGEDGGNHFISLEIDAADFAGAIVDVVVGVKLGVLGSDFDELGGWIFGFGIAEMLLNIGPGTEQALLFAGPKADADCATHLDAGGFKDADGFEHDGRAGAVVGSASSCVPGIEMRTKHDDFVGLGFVGAGDFADDVEGVGVVIVELVLDVDLKGDGDFLFEHAVNAAVVFNSNSNARRSGRVLFFVAAAALLNKYGAIVAA